jgi:hypothetical protein
MLGWPEGRRLPVATTRPGVKPRLRVFRSSSGDGWLWTLTVGDHGMGGFGRDYGQAATHGEALAVGLAALETASVRSKA